MLVVGHTTINSDCWKVLTRGRSDHFSSGYPPLIVNCDLQYNTVIMAVLRSRCGHYIFVLWFLLLLLFSSPNLSGCRVDVYRTSFYTWCGLSANLECRSVVCCARLAGNTGRKNDAKNRDLRTVTQFCRAKSLQLRRVSTIGKKHPNWTAKVLSKNCVQAYVIGLPVPCRLYTDGGELISRSHAHISFERGHRSCHYVTWMQLKPGWAQ